MNAPDVVYVVRPGDNNEELRHSLRSLVNLPHGQVWIAGHRPWWVSREVRWIRVPPARTRYASSTANVRAACAHPEISASWVLMNDDFFVLRPIGGVPPLHRGPVAALSGPAAAGSSSYRAGATATRKLLAELGYDDPMSYELHVPMLIHGPTMGRLLDWAAGRVPALHKRTLYGNVAHVGGSACADVKVHRGSDDWDRALPFVSTSDATFRAGRVGAWLRERFATPGPYERAGRRTG